mgnify:CR=1 FL=1
MGRVGFIQDKLEIKFLILYVASRLIEPVPFEAGADDVRRRHRLF